MSAALPRTPPSLTEYQGIRFDGRTLASLWQGTYGVSGATNDPDVDGFSNLSEWINGTLPNSASSKIVVNGFDGDNLVFPARAYDLYQVWSASTVDGVYVPLGNAVRPTTSVGTARVDRASANQRFLKLERIQ